MNEEKELLKADQIDRILESGEFSLEQFVVMLCMASAISLMVGDRNDAYNDGGVEIKDYWDTFKDSFQMIKIKYLRIKSSSSRIDQNIIPSQKPLLELTDSCIDIMNFTGFHLANVIRTTNSEGSLRSIGHKYHAQSFFLAIVEAVRAFHKNKNEEVIDEN